MNFYGTQGLRHCVSLLVATYKPLYSTFIPFFSFLSGDEIKREIGEEQKEEGPNKKRPKGYEVEMNKKRITDDSEGIPNGSIPLIYKNIYIHIFFYICIFIYIYIYDRAYFNRNAALY